MSDEVKLEPCPGCAGCKIGTARNGDGWWQRICRDCGWQGPLKQTKAEATAAWNSRPTIVTGQLEGELIRELVSFVEVIANARVDAMTGSIVLGNIGAPAVASAAKRLLAKAQPGGSNAHSE